jgi:hypothetical protein
MTQDPIDFLLGGKPKAKPVTTPDPRKASAVAMDSGLKILSGGTVSLKKVQTESAKEDSLRPNGLGDARRVAEQRIKAGPATHDVLESALYMNARDSKGNLIQPDTEASRVREYSVDPKTRDSIIAEFKKDPIAAAKKYDAQRQTYRDVRTKSVGNAQMSPMVADNSDPTAGKVPATDPAQAEIDAMNPNVDRFNRSKVDNRPQSQQIDEGVHAVEKGIGQGINTVINAVPKPIRNIVDPMGAMQQGARNLGAVTGAIVTSPAQIISALDYAGDPSNPPFDRTMSFINGLGQLEGLAGGPVSAPLVERALKGGWQGIKALVSHLSPQEVEGIAKASGQSVEQIQKGLQGAQEAIVQVPDEVGNAHLQPPAPETGVKEPLKQGDPGTYTMPNGVVMDHPASIVREDGTTDPVNILAHNSDGTSTVQLHDGSVETVRTHDVSPEWNARHAHLERPDLAPKETISVPEAPQVANGVTPTAQIVDKPKRTVQDVQAEIDAVKQRMQNRGQTGRPQTTTRGGAGTKIGPDDIKDAVTLGRLHFEKGLRSFDDWSREMISSFGSAIRQHLPEIWKQVNQPVTGDSVDRLQQALNEASPLRESFANQLSSAAQKERAGRLAGAQSASVGKPLSESLGKQLGSQKGSYANYSFELPAPISEDDLQHLKDMVLTHPQLSPYDKLNAQLALEKIAGDGQYGGLPTSGEIASLEKVFGKGIGTKLRTMDAPSFWEEIVLYRKAGLLTGPRTILRNALGNFVNAVRNEGLRPFDAVSDQLVSLAFKKYNNGQRTIAGVMLPSAERTQAVLQKTTQDVAEIMKHGQSIDGTSEVFKESRNPLVKYALRFQGVQDAIWMNSAYERSLLEQATLMAKKDKSLDVSALVNSPTEAMDLQAQIDSQIATFNAPNKLSDSIKKLTQVPGVGKLIEFLVPFKKVPSNIGSEMLQANPAGTMYNLAKAINEVNKTGELSYTTQRALSKSVVNGTLGGTLLWMGTKLAQEGKLTGSAPVDPTQKTTNEALGIRPASLQIGDARYQLTGTHPMFSVMALGASMYESAQKRFDQATTQADKIKSKGLNPTDFGVKPQTGQVDPKQDAGSWAVAFGSLMQEQPFLKGIKDFMDAASSERKMQSVVNSAASSFAPTLISDAQRMAGKGDDRIRDTIGKGLAPDAWDAFRSRLGFGKDLPAKVDAFGKEIKLGGVFDVTNAKEVKADPVAVMMKNNGLTVTKLQRLPTEDAKHYETRQQLYGQFLYHVAQSAEPTLSRITDKKVLKEVWGRINDEVRSKLGGGLNTDVLKKLPTSQPSTQPTKAN